VTDLTFRKPEHSLIIRFLTHRFVKFGVVGLAGTVVNQIVLYFAYEILFRGIHSPGARLNLSLSLAIFLATINNYIWNRNWTWGDRKDQINRNFFLQLGQYFLACSGPIALQFVFTRVLAYFMQYLIANVISIVIAAILTYLFNDLWTFAVKTSPQYEKPNTP
jgi:putative flippase GtrA